MIETSSVPNRESSGIFGKSPKNVRKRSPYLRNNFGKIFGNLRKVVGNLRKIVRSLVRYGVEHSQIKFISTRGHVISSIYFAISIKIDFVILTDYHPCNGRTCPFYAVCQAPTKTTHRCVCVPCETDESSPLCDNNDVTHKNKCEYNYHVCLAQEEPGIKHYGGCKRKSFVSSNIVL